MGATESIFYDDEPPRDQDHPNTHPKSLPQDVQHRVADGRQRGTRRLKQRARPRPGGTNDLPLQTLHGSILGLPSSGKNTLLERLKGKDPFENPEAREKTDPTENDPKAVTVVPYQAPSNSAVWDRLQIKVQASSEISLEGKNDFAVVLINPHQEPNRIQSYLVEVITRLLDNQQSNSALCMCFLVNFRDLNTKKNRGIQEGDVKQCVHAILQQLAEQLPTADQLLLEFGSTSLCNCYGLATLHHFIYAAYLRSKRNELEYQLHLVQTEVSKPHQAPRIKYKEFLKMVKESTPASSERQPGQPEALPSDTAIDRQGINGHQDDETVGAEANTNNLQQIRRKVVGNDMTREKPEAISTPSVPQTYETAKLALEDFLASDDEEDVAMNRKGGRPGSIYDDEEDDDDFFYNEAGERCSLRNGKPASAQPSKPVEQRVPEASSNIKPSIQASGSVDSTEQSRSDKSTSSRSETVENTPSHQVADWNETNPTPENSRVDEAEDKTDEHDEPREGRPGEDQSTVQDHGEDTRREPGPGVYNSQQSEQIETAHGIIEGTTTDVTGTQGKEGVDSEKFSAGASTASEAANGVASRPTKETGGGEPNGEAEIHSKGIAESTTQSDGCPASSSYDPGENDADPQCDDNSSSIEEDDDGVLQDTQETAISIGDEAIAQTHDLEANQSGLPVQESDSDDDFIISASAADCKADLDEGRSSTEDADAHTDDPDTSALAITDGTTSGAATQTDSPIKHEAGNDSEDDEEFFIGEVEGKVQEEAPDTVASSGNGAEKDEEDTKDTRSGKTAAGYSIVGPLQPGHEAVKQQEDANKEASATASDSRSDPTASTKASLSAAAQAAIAAAQKEAEAMLQQSTGTPPSKSEKKAKKKKDSKKKEKKLKKEKKAKRKEKAEDHE